LITGLIIACIKRINTPQDMSLEGMYSMLWILMNGMSAILPDKEDVYPLLSQFSHVWTLLAPVLSRLGTGRADVIIGLDWELAGFTPMKSVISDVVSPYTRYDRSVMEQVALYFTDKTTCPLLAQDGSVIDGDLGDILSQRVRIAGALFARTFPMCMEEIGGVFMYVGVEEEECEVDIEDETSEESVEAIKSHVEDDIVDLDEEMQELLVFSLYLSHSCGNEILEARLIHPRNHSNKKTSQRTLR
jgi:hypothetical protein